MAIKGNVKVHVSKEYILERLSEYEIYRYYVGHDFVIGRTFCSPFRKEVDPSFSITVTRNGRLHHVDFGDSTKRGDCFSFVKQMFFALNFDEVLVKIAKDFNIISSKDAPLGRREKMTVVNNDGKKETLIQVVTRKFDTADLAYWGSYHITEKELKDNDIYAVKKLYLNRDRIMIPATELVFGYLMEDKWKIYRPLADKKNKWLCNVPGTYISGMHRITDGCHNAVVTKAKKDEIVLAKFIPHVASVQSESQIAICKEDIDILKGKCREVYLNFDSDEVGVQACKYYNQFGFKWVNCPKGFNDPNGKMIKDFADLAKYYGLETVIKHFKDKKVIS